MTLVASICRVARDASMPTAAQRYPNRKDIAHLRRGLWISLGAVSAMQEDRNWQQSFD
jgi:hypothetical protein